MKKRLINIEPVRDIVRDKLIEKYNATTYINTEDINIKLDIKDLLEEYINARSLTPPTIYISANAYVKMRMLVDQMSTEVGWYGTVTKCPGLQETYVIEDILVYPQKVTGATCEQDETKMFDFEMSLTTEQVNTKRFQGHSHVNMGVTPSGVDEQFYQDLLTQVNDYFIICITNKKNDYTVRFYDVANNILYTDLELKVLLDDGTDTNNWFTLVKDQVANKTIVTVDPNKPGNFKGSIFDTGDTKSSKELAKEYDKRYYDWDDWDYYEGYRSRRPRGKR